MRYALWDDRISVKISIRASPFQLVYGKQADLPIQLELLVLKLIQNETESNDLVRRMYELICATRNGTSQFQIASESKEKEK